MFMTSKLTLIWWLGFEHFVLPWVVNSSIVVEFHQHLFS